MQSEKLRWQSESNNYHNKNLFVAPVGSCQRTEIGWILEKLPEHCFNIIDFCCGNGGIATLFISIRLLRNYPFDQVFANIDYLIAKSGLKLLDCHVIVHVKKLVTR